MPQPSPAFEGTSIEADTAQLAGRRRARPSPVGLGVLAAVGAVVAAAGLIGLDLFVGLSGPGAGGSTISAYIYTDYGWAFQACMVALIIGSAALLGGLIVTGLAPPRSTGTVLLALAVVAMVAILVFPKTNWAVGDSTHGQIHRLASITAFLAGPIGIMLLTRRSARRHCRHPAATAAFWLAAGALAWLTPLLVAAANMLAGGRPWWRVVPLGLMERGIVFTEIAAMIAVATWLLVRARGRARLVGSAAAQS